MNQLPRTPPRANRQEIYISTDVEADGPIPGPHSMLSFGSAAYLADKTLLTTFSANLDTLPEAQGHPDTMAWWATQPVAWAACRSDCEAPEAAMHRYVAWLKALPGNPVFVGYPAGYDFMFVYWYLMRFAGESPEPSTTTRPVTSTPRRCSARVVAFAPPRNVGLYPASIARCRNRTSATSLSETRSIRATRSSTGSLATDATGRALPDVAETLPPNFTAQPRGRSFFSRFM